MVEDNCSSARPAFGPSRRRNDHGYKTEGWIFTTQQRPEGIGEVSIEVHPTVCHQEGSWRSQTCAAQGNGGLPVRNEVPGCSREGPFLRRIAHRGTFNLRRVAVAFHNAGPLRIPLADAGRHDGPDVLALKP
jgi:hypothetical protein